MSLSVLQVGYTRPTGLTDPQGTVLGTLRDLGHRVRHLSLFEPDATEDGHRGLGADARDLKGWRRRRLRSALGAFLAKERFAVLIAHRYRVAHALAPLPALPSRRFLLVHGCGVLAAFGRRRVARRLLADGWRVLAVSEAVRRDLCAHGLREGEVEVLHNALDADALRAALLDRGAARARLGAPAEGPLLGAVGRLIPKKGFDVLLRAAEGHLLPAPLLLVGDGRERADLERRARACGAGAVRLCGPVPGAAALMPAFDAVLVPSRDEGFGLVALEAMAAGVPLAVSSAGGLPEVVGDVAPVVPVGDAPALARAATALLAEPPEERARRVRRQRARAADLFGLARYRERWGALLS
jgi:glycosyltransferase involved in cell wall biosynthesis